MTVRKTPPMALLAMLFVGLSGCSVAPLRSELPYRPLNLEGGPGPKTFAAQRPSPEAGQVQQSEWSVGARRPWRYIVVHHSATNVGNAAEFDAAHRARGWDELGYHFVIDNGNGGPDGCVEVGSRWTTQKWGAHCKTANNEYNNYGIGIALVGDFRTSMPTDRQLASLRRLLKYLMETYDISPEAVIGHCDAPGTSTECPGHAFHAFLNGRLRPELVHRLAAGQ